VPDQILVLVAEDEELVRLVIVTALEDAGFEVLEANTPKRLASKCYSPISICRAPWMVSPLRIIRQKTGLKSRCF
jgi:hypothetical protein